VRVRVSGLPITCDNETLRLAASAIANNKEDVLHAEMLRTKAGNTIDRGIVRFKIVPSILRKIEQSFIRIGPYHLRFHFLDDHECSLCKTRGHTHSQCDQHVSSATNDNIPEEVITPHVIQPIVPSQSVAPITALRDRKVKGNEQARATSTTNVPTRPSNTQNKKTGKEKEKEIEKEVRGKGKGNPRGGTLNNAIQKNFSPPPLSGGKTNETRLG
jgi:hypothetical protein